MGFYVYDLPAEKRYNVQTIDDKSSLAIQTRSLLQSPINTEMQWSFTELYWHFVER